MIGMTAFFLIAPYSFLDGVFTLDLAGKQGCAATGSPPFSLFLTGGDISFLLLNLSLPIK
jgi:hypothetical protein